MAEPHDPWDFYTLVAALRRRWKIVLLCLIIVPAVVVALSLSQKKQYTANAVVLFRDTGLDQVLFGSAVLPPSTDPTRAAATNIRLIELATVADNTARVLGRSHGYVSSRVSVSAEGDSDLVMVSATDVSPATAVRLADTYADQYVAFSRNSDQQAILTAANQVQSKLSRPGTITHAQRRLLRRERLKLQVLAGLQTGGASVVQPAQTPTAPSAPQTKRDGVLAAIAGLLIGVALALVLDRVDRRLRDPEDAQEVFDRPILARVPESRQFRRRGQPLRASEAEAFRMLRTSLLYFNGDIDIRSLLITSAGAAEGKSTVAWNLAAAVAAAGGNVLLIEADLRHPNLANLSQARALEQPGLSQVLTGALDAEDVTVRVPVPRLGREDDDGPVMHVIFSGPVPPEPADLLESQRMLSLIQQAESRYDLVVIDGPSTYLFTDAVPLINQVSGVIIVTRLGTANRDAARHLRDQLENLNAHTVGLVVNGARERDAYNSVNGNGRGPRRRRRRQRAV